MTTCIWCDKEVSFYVCPVCLTWYEKICCECHRIGKHGTAEEKEVQGYQLNWKRIEAGPFGSGGICWGPDDYKRSWVENPEKALELYRID